MVQDRRKKRGNAGGLGGGCRLGDARACLTRLSITRDANFSNAGRARVARDRCRLGMRTKCRWLPWTAFNRGEQFRNRKRSTFQTPEELERATGQQDRQ